MRTKHRILYGNNSIRDRAEPGSLSLLRRLSNLKMVIALSAICTLLFVTGLTSVPIVRASTGDHVAARGPKAEASCNDFEFAFLHPICAKSRAAHLHRHDRFARFAPPMEAAR